MKRVLPLILFLMGISWPRVACAALGVQQWVDLLHSDEESTAQSAEAQLVKLGSEAVRPLQRVLEDGNFKVRLRAADVLGQIGAPAKRAAPDLVRLLTDPLFDVQASAQKALLRLGDDAVPALSEALRSDREGLRKIALDTLGRLGPKGIPYLYTILKTDDNSILRATAAEALGRIQPVRLEMTQALVQALSDLDEGVRGAAADSLGQGGASSVIAVRPLFVMSRDDKDALTRHRAEEALLQVGVSTPSVGSIVAAEYQRLLKDENLRSRSDAVEALSRLGVVGLPGLLQGLEDRDAGVSAGASNAIVQLGPAAIPSLESLKGSSFPYLSRKASDLLDQIQKKPKRKRKKS